MLVGVLYKLSETNIIF